jgi:2-iminobutanoate/2-iminopropanoate deaminase
MERELFVVEGMGNRHLYSGVARYGDLIFTAGVTAADENGVMPDDFKTQVSLTLDTLERAVKTAGGDLGTIMKVTTFLANIDDFAAYNEVYTARFEGLGLPARATVQVGKFPGNLAIEIEAIAHVREAAS